jgi:glycosyltransferase A (GT-A) superfamily protein (DUF2064 family)
MNIVLVAKDPAHGAVKTRLQAGGVYAPHLAAEVAEAMLRCIAARLRRLPGRLVLAVSPDGTGPDLAARLGIEDTECLDQGDGDLGERLDRLWRQVGVDTPVAFFGGDSPDVPDAALAGISGALARADVAVGPTADGGYWTLAAASYRPEVIRNIDWGSGHVYDQTCRMAAETGLVVAPLPIWHDVDRPQDVDELRLRLREHGSRGGGEQTGPTPLGRLAERLESLCSAISPLEGTTS